MASLSSRQPSEMRAARNPSFSIIPSTRVPLLTVRKTLPNTSLTSDPTLLLFSLLKWRQLVDPRAYSVRATAQGIRVQPTCGHKISLCRLPRLPACGRVTARFLTCTDPHTSKPTTISMGPSGASHNLAIPCTSVFVSARVVLFLSANTTGACTTGIPSGVRTETRERAILCPCRQRCSYCKEPGKRRQWQNQPSHAAVVLI